MCPLSCAGCPRCADIFCEGAPAAAAAADDLIADSDDEMDMDDEGDEGEGAGAPRSKAGVKERLYSLEQLREAVLRILGQEALGLTTPSAVTVAREMGLSSMTTQLKRTVAAARNVKQGEHTTPWKAQVEWVNAYVFKTKGGAAAGDREIFDEDTSGLIAVACDYAAAGGFGLDRKRVRVLMIELVRANNLRDRDGRLHQISKTFCRSWMRDHGVGLRKTSALDPKRARQATAIA